MADVALREYVNEIDGMIENSAYDVAIQHCRHILSLYPKYLEVYRVLGKALLEKDDYAAAGDVFQRVISVDPEDFVARVGLSIVYDRQGELDQAIWHMERAYDLMPSNEIIQSELRRLCGRRDGHELERVTLTRSALARMYANGDLAAEAIAHLRQLLRDQPDRVDLQVLLAEVLWRDNQRIDASEQAQAITAKLPYCLKANLLLGEILQASGSPDSETPFRRAQAVDPDNLQAAQLLGSASTLPVRQTIVSRLEQRSYGQLLETEGAVDREEVPDWLRGLADLNAPLTQLEAPESATNPPLPTGLHMPGTEPAHAEIPDWLQGLTAPQSEAAGPSQEVPDWLTALGTASLGDKPTKSSAIEPGDDWLAQLQTPSAPEPVTAMRDEEVPDWILQLGTGALDPRKLPQTEQTADETPDWMKQLGGTGALDAAPAEAPIVAVDDETPDWLRQLGSTGPLDQSVATQPAARSAAVVNSAAETPDWLAQLAQTAPETAVVPTEADEVPDWLRQLGNTGPLEPTVVSAASEETSSDWLSQIQSTAAVADDPLDDEVPDWLTQLGSTGPLPQVETPPARKIAVDTDRATVERLVEAFSPSPAKAAQPTQAEEDKAPFSLGDVASEVGKAGAGLVLGGAALAGAAVSGLTDLVKGHDVEEVAAPKMAAPEAADSVELEASAILEGDISPDDALAFFARLTAGKEAQLQAEAQAEGESRMAAIMGRKAEPVVEAKPVEPEPVIEPVAAPVAEIPVESEPVAVEASAILEGDISPDDALAFFARLTAGKEAQLQAEAQAEGESRMAAIMGRKVEPVVEMKPVEPEPVIEAVAAPVAEVSVESEPAAVEASAILEGDISPDDALAFFARLTAGKEAQLQAEAQAEGESRMAAIMGRKVESVVEVKPVEPEPVIEPVAAPVAEIPVESEPTAAEAAAILEGDISPDDALAFFARLTAGKEAQLQAEAQAEGESRMAAIMGRKVEPVVEVKPVEPEPVIEPVAEVVVESEPAAVEASAILEGDISPDDALAFFARLTAGKEAQLQAEAQAEGESRMAAIMGRKVEPVVEVKPVEPEPVIEPEPEAVASTEDTTNWLAQLSAAAAAAALEPAAESSDEEPIDWLKGLGESAPVAAPVDELPDWLRAMRPPDEALAAESGLTGALDEIESTPAEALPDWLRAMQPAADASIPTEAAVTEEFSATLDSVSDEPVADLTPASALPTWLQDLQPSAAAAELTPAESLPDWLRNLQPETVEVVAEQVEASEPVMELPQAEEAPSVAEVVAEQPVAPITEALPEPIITPISVRVQSLVADVKPEKSAAPITPTWWTQSAEDEGEAPIAELPEPVRMATTTARMTATPLAPVPAAARPPITRAMRDRLPERLTREPRRRDVRPAEPRRVEAAPRHVEAAPAPVSSVNVDPLVEQLEADKFNYAVRLDLARAWWSMGNRESALAEYSKLINPAQVENLSDEELAAIEERDFADAGPVADDLIVDLERIVEIDDHPAWPRLLGDLYMKTGDLARALELYRRALSQL